MIVPNNEGSHQEYGKAGRMEMASYGVVEDCGQYEIGRLKREKENESGVEDDHTSAQYL